MTDDIQKVREAYKEAAKEAGFPRESYDSRLPDFFAALAKRLQPRSEPVKKVWQASPAVALKFATEWHRHTLSAGVLADYRKPIDAIAEDYIRERPDLVKADVQRRLAAARFPDDLLLPRLFPELGP